MTREVRDVPIVHFGFPQGTDYVVDGAAAALASLEKIGWVDVKGGKG